MKLLVTGGCGFLGSNLVKSFLAKDAEIIIIDNLSKEGSKINLNWLIKHSKKNKLNFFNSDISDEESIDEIFKKFSPFDYVCHLAGQVAMTTSIEKPYLDLSTNLLGTFILLEKVRKYSNQALFAFSSTNKVYGDLNWIKKEGHKDIYSNMQMDDETIPLDFSSPYGCSSSLINMSEIGQEYMVKTVVFRHSSIYGEDNIQPIIRGG